jgi:hypothetical protein
MQYFCSRGAVCVENRISAAVVVAARLRASRAQSAARCNELNRWYGNWAAVMEEIRKRTAVGSDKRPDSRETEF